MYVDNLLTGVNSSKEAREFYSEPKEVFQESSMNLREWGSNCKEFLKSIPEQDGVKETITKVLGILWNTVADQLAVKGSKPTECSSKREVLKSIATVFDPLGFFTPATLRGKLFLEELWASEKEWDEKLEEEMLHKWLKIQKENECISMVTIPRFIGNSSCQLLYFCDASAKAYVSVVYLSSDAGVNLLFSKARVAPIKKLGIPRLELLVVLIGVRMLKFVQEQLQLPVEKKVLWTDNQCVLHWIMSKRPLTTFVQNRVKEITETKDISFRYVITSQNPAALWQVWKDDYLLNLRERSQTHVKGPQIQAAEEPKVGSVVLLKEDLPLGVWKMGKITELISSSDGKFRTAKVLLPTKKVLKRPLNLLYPLECGSFQEIETTQNGGQLKKLWKIPQPLCDLPEQQQLEHENRCKDSFLPK